MNDYKNPEWTDGYCFSNGVRVGFSWLEGRQKDFVYRLEAVKPMGTDRYEANQKLWNVHMTHEGLVQLIKMLTKAL